MQASVVVAPGLQSTGLIVMACRLHCPEACGTFLDQGMNPCPLMRRWILYHWATREDPWAIFLFKFKMDCKAVETTHNINNAFGPGTANEHTGRWWSRSFAKETRAWKWGVQWLAIESWQYNQLRAIIKADSLITTWEVDQEFNVNHSMVIWSKLEMWKSLISGCLMTRLKSF